RLVPAAGRHDHGHMALPRGRHARARLSVPARDLLVERRTEIAPLHGPVAARDHGQEAEVPAVAAHQQQRRAVGRAVAGGAELDPLERLVQLDLADERGDVQGGNHGSSLPRTYTATVSPSPMTIAPARPRPPSSPRSAWRSPSATPRGRVRVT